MPDDPNEIPAYFSAVEKIFQRYEVPKQIQSQLFMPKLNDKSKSLLVKLSSEKQNDYRQVRNFLLREFRLTAEQYRDQFWTATKKSDETYTLFGSRVKTLFQYYLDSRKAESKDDVIDLLVSDRIKQTLSDSCLRHVLATEGSQWFKPDELASVIDTYLNSHLCLQRGSTGFRNPKFPKANQGGAKNYQVDGKDSTSVTSTGTLVDSKSSLIRCWNCNLIGHRASNCKSASKSSAEAKRTGKEKSVVTPQVATAKTNHVGIVSYSQPDVTYYNLIGAKLAFPIPELRFPHPVTVTDIGLGEGKIHSSSNILSYDDNLPVKASSVSTFYNLMTTCIMCVRAVVVQDSKLIRLKYPY